MSGRVPNGPCSNDVDVEEVPCRPFLLFVHDDDDDDDEPPPLLTQEIGFGEATTTSSAPTTTMAATETADNTADGAVDASSTVSDAAATVDEEPQIDTAEGATDSSINLDTHTGNNKENVSGIDNTIDASDSTNNEVDAAEPGASDTSVGAAETGSNPDIDTDADGMEAGTGNTEDTADDADNGATNVELQPGVDNATDEAADNDANPNSAIDAAAEESKAAVDNTAAGADEKNNDADTAANTDVVAGTADNSDNPDAAIESDGEQKVDEDDTIAGANANHGAVDDIDKEQDSEVVGGVDSAVDWSAIAEEFQMENNEVSESSPTVNDESSSGNEAVGTGSNASGSISNVTTEDNLVEEEEEAKVDSGSTSTPATEDVEETSQTLYTSPDASNSKPDDAVKVLLRFDYDLTTASNFNGDTLSSLEDSIASDLAQIYGLIAVSTSRRVTKRRRYLRKLTVDDVMALDSQPVDVNVANTYECQDQDIDPNFTCTPISGFMTAYLGPETDEEASKTAILSFVEQGMELGSYEDNEIIKVTYIGTRSNRDDMTSTELRLEQQTSLSNESSLAIGLSAFFLVFAALVSFVALNNREKKKKRRSSDNSMGASAEMSQNTIGVDVLEITTPVAPVGNKYANNVGSTTMSSSGDEAEDGHMLR